MAVQFNGADLVVDFQEQPLNGAERQYQIDYVCADITVTHFVQAVDGIGDEGERRYTDTLTFAENKAAGLTRNPTVRMRTQDADGYWSDFYEVLAQNPITVFANPPVITATYDGVDVEIETPGDGDFAGYVVWVSDDPTCPMVDANIRWKGPGKRFLVPLPDDDMWFLRVCPYDAFGIDLFSATAPLAVYRKPDASDIADAISDGSGGYLRIRDALNDVTSIQADIDEVFRNTLPQTFDQDGDHFFADYAGDPATRTPIIPNATFGFPTVSSVGKVIQVNVGAGGSIDVSPISARRLQPGRRMRVTARVRMVSGTGTSNIQPYNIGLNGSYALTTNFTYSNNNLSTASGWVEISSDLLTDNVISQGAVWMRPMIRCPGNAGAVSWQIQFIRCQDITDSFDANLSASAASSSASAAGDSAAAAYTSQTVAASIGANSMNSNPLFANYSNPSGAPDGYSIWAGSCSRVAGGNQSTSPYGCRIVSTAGGQSGITQAIGGTGGSNRIKTGDHIVVEAQIRLNSGTLAGSGVFANIRNSGAAGAAGQSVDKIEFFTDPDATGTVVGAGAVNTNYNFSKIIKINGTNAWYVQLYGMAAWDAMPGGIAGANDITFYKLSCRMATEAEVATGTVSSGLRASVDVLSGAVATMSGKQGAYWKAQTFAGSGAGTFVSLTAETTNPSAAPLTFVPTTNCVVDQDRRIISRTSGTGWNSGANSLQGYTAGAYVAAQPNLSNTASMMIGLNSDPSSNKDHPQLDYAIYLAADGTVHAWESGVNAGTLVTGYYQSDTFSVEYSGSTVTYKRNGTVLRTVGTTSNRTFYLDSSISQPNHAWKNVVFSSAGPSSTSDVGIGARTVSLYNYDTSGFYKVMDVTDGVGRFYGKLWADNLQVGQVDTHNKVYNGSGQLGNTDGWVKHGSSGSIGAATYLGQQNIGQGDSSSRLVIWGANAGFMGRPIKVVPGRTYRCRINVLANANTGTGMYLGVETSPSVSGLGTTNRVDGYGNVGCPTGATWYEWLFTAPSGHYWAAPAIYNWVGGAPSYLCFAGFSFEEMAGDGVRIKDGSVLANHISVSSISAISGNMGTLVAQRINVADFAINGQKIEDLSTSNMVTGFASSQVALTTGATYTGIASVSVSTVGKPVKIDVSTIVGFGSTTGSYVNFRILRSGAALVSDTVAIGTAANGLNAVFTYQIVDQPGAGTYSYVLEMSKVQNAATVYCQNRSISAHEARK